MPLSQFAGAGVAIRRPQPIKQVGAVDPTGVRGAGGYCSPKNRKLGELVLARGASWFMPAARVRPRGLSGNR